MITLYISGHAVDLDNQELVLLNIQASDIYNPAAVKNSYSQDITLPGTPNNDAIFGHCFRMDSVVTGFDPSKRADFSIYNDTGEILVAGYCKLNQISDEGGVHTYSLSLYGGLGGFLYNLSMKSDGSKMTLADLDYLGGGDNELNFKINATNVQSAWDRLAGDNTQPEMWDVINFAPCYNGIPEDFTADKAVGLAADFGLDIPTGYTTENGYTLINLSEEVDEWAAKDLRSYLQRPVISMRAIISAIANANNNGGWSVDYSDINSVPYLDTWLTRPLLPSLGTYKQTEHALTTTFSGSTGTSTLVGTIVNSGNLPAGSMLTTTFSFSLAYNGTGATDAVIYGNDFLTPHKEQVLFLQAVGYDSNNTAVGASATYVICKSGEAINASSIANWCGYTPNPKNTELIGMKEHGYAKDGTSYKRQADFSMEVSGKNMATIEVSLTAGMIWVTSNSVIYQGGLSTKPFTNLWTANNVQLTPTTASVTPLSVFTTYQSTDSLRSGAQITKKMLLSTSKSPAEYLVSFCKMCGFYLIADQATMSVKILKRESFYQNETIDLSSRIDRTYPIQSEPIGYNAKWYELKQESVGGRFEEEYLKTEGVQYGIQRIDTGYDFDSEVKDLLSGSAFKSCAAVRDKGKYYLVATTPAVIDKTETNGFYIADAGQIAQATISWLLGKIHITAPGYYTFGTNLNNPSHTILAEYSDSTYTYRTRIVEGPGTPTTITHFLTPGYYAIASDGNTEFDISGQVFQPSPFMSGCTYTLWDADGKGEEYNVPVPPSYTWMNNSFPGYDTIHSKAEFRDAENKAIDGADVLLFYNYDFPYAHFALSDDLSVMDTLNSGPCWMFAPNATGQSIPFFTRYTSLGQNPIDLLEFGYPREIDIPLGDYHLGTTLYYHAWRNYLIDRLNVNNKVMRCKVDLSGLQVGVDLLRKFYWYRNSLWVLSKISNYSLTTFDPAECEFIQVRDKSNYTSGQY